MAQPSMEDFQALNAVDGLPANIRDEIENSLGSRLIRFVSNWLYFVVMISGFLVGASIWRKLEDITLQNAKEFAATVSTIWIDTSFGLSSLIGLFVWIFASGLVVTLIIRLIPMPIKAGLFFGTRKEIKWAFQDFSSSWSSRNELVSHMDAGDGINRSLENYLKRSAGRFMPFVILVCGLAALETRHFNVVAEDGLYDGNFFTGKMELKPWKDAETVLLGCNHTDDGGRLIYEIIFDDGYKKRIPVTDHMNGQHWLVNLETIDAKIVEAGANFERWSWLKRDPLDAKCLRGFYGELGLEHKHRFDDILRIGQFSGDNSPSL